MENESLIARLTAKLVRLFALLAVVFLALASFGPVIDNVDLGWHIAQGRWMFQHVAIYRHDAFNYPNLGHPVIDEYPLFQIVLYAAWCAGWWAPCLLTALVYVSLAILLISAARPLDAVYRMAFIVALSLMLLCLQVGPMLRPHMVTYLAIVILGLFLLRHREARRWTQFWPMALLQIAWTNCHSGFVIGPAMVSFFGAEVTVRHWVAERKFPTATALTWLGAFALILLSCLVNPFGPARFYPPFVQEHLESIRAYVGEMEPLPGLATRLYTFLSLFAAVILWSANAKGGWARFHPSFILLAAFFFWEALSAKKAWPVFGLFVPLIVLSAGLHGPTPVIARRKMTWAQVATVDFIFTCFLCMGVFIKFNQVRLAWAELRHERSELSIAAVPWMQAHGIAGRLFHRCEDGGWLQQAGYDQGEVFSDTGFGKYDEAFIHEVGLVSERPKLLPRYLSAYRPDAVVCSNFCYQWPAGLKALGWRMVFYAPNSSVWIAGGARPDLPAVSDDAIRTAFQQDLAQNGEPAEIALFGRNIVALNSLGLDDFAFAELTGIPAEEHKTPWYWEAARLLCFDDPPSSHRADFEREAEQIGVPAITSEFRAYDAYFVEHNDVKAREDLLQGTRDKSGHYQFGNWAAELLLRIYLENNDPQALDLARHTGYFNLRNGRHWQYLAQAEERWGSLDAARVAWRKAVFYYPDDDELMNAANEFAQKHDDADLAREIADSSKIYGESSR